MAGNNKGNRRRFGAVRQLPSGRWQARYPDPQTGRVRTADRTFDTKRDAEIELSKIEADQARGEWHDPDAGRVNFAEYASAWIAERDLSETTRERYEGILRNHLTPTFGSRDVCDIKEAHVRQWRKERLDSRAGAPTIVKAYRLLRAILYTAVDDEMIKRNPCRIKGAGNDDSAERPVLTVEQVYAIADAITPRYRVLVLLATFASLRLGELAALRRRDIDLEEAQVWVRRSQAELKGGLVIVKDPKSKAGRRPVAIPDVVIPELRRHLEWFAAKDLDGLVFVGPKGGRLLRRNFHRLWTKALKAAGIEGADIHFHDLRHTGNTVAAASGASTKELMTRLGHSTMRAALIYQHATRERDQEIAKAMSARVRKARSKKPTKRAKTGRTDGRSGTDLARGE
jgi:integrase